MNNILSQLKSKPYVILLLVFVYMMYFHVRYTSFEADDIAFAAGFNELHSLNDFIARSIKSYLTWSSRLITETVNMFFVSRPIIIWQIADSLLICLLVYTIVELVEIFVEFSRLALYALVSFIMCFVFPIYDMSTAGWGTTTVMNLWNTIAALYVLMVAIGQYRLNVKLNHWTAAPYFVALIYGCNTELTIIPLFLVMSFINIGSFIKHRLSKLQLVSLLITFLFFLNALLSPGNAARVIAEMSWLPGFIDFSFCEKILLGITATFDRYYSFENALWCRNMSIIYFVLICFLWLGCHHLYKSKYIDLLMFIPIALYAFRSDYAVLIDYSSYFDTVSSYTVFKKQYVMPLILYSLVFATNLTGVFLITRALWKGNIALLLTLLFFSMFCTRFIMSLTPTIYASSYRTYVFLNIGLIIYCVLFGVLTLKHRFNLFSTSDGDGSLNRDQE